MKQNTQKLKIVYVDIDLLKEADYNPRIWDDEATDQLKDSVRKFGLVDPLLVNSAKSRENIVIGGHFRLSIARDLNLKQVPVVYLDIPDLEKERELNLRLNKNLGSWDWDKIMQEYDVGALIDVGFSGLELSDHWDDLIETEDDDFKIEKELEKVKSTNIKLGDLFALGRHKLICGDSTKPEIVKKLCGDTKINLINTDIPYNIGIDYNSGIGGKRNFGGKTNDKKSDADYRQFVKSLIENGLSVCQKDCHVFFWLAEKYVGMMQELYKEAGIDQKRLCFWIKDNQNPVPKIAFNKATELCLYGTRGIPYLNERIKNLNEAFNKELTTGARLLDDIMDIFNIWLVKRLPTTQYKHPTEKSPTLYEKSLRRCSKPGDNILDMTSGSGALLIACHQLKRTAYLVEVEPIFCQLILNRYETLTNEKTKKLN